MLLAKSRSKGRCTVRRCVSFCCCHYRLKFAFKRLLILLFNLPDRRNPAGQYSSCRPPCPGFRSASAPQPNGVRIVPANPGRTPARKDPSRLLFVVRPEFAGILCPGGTLQGLFQTGRNLGDNRARADERPPSVGGCASCRCLCPKGGSAKNIARTG